MNPSEKNKLYEKYMSGDISRAEMHRLNQYALEDDFLFDALEGAASFEDGNTAALQELASKLEEKVSTKTRPYRLWMSIAAGIAILVFAVTFLQLPTNEQISDVMTENEVEYLEDSAVKEDLTIEDESPAFAGSSSPKPARQLDKEPTELQAPRPEKERTLVVANTSEGAEEEAQTSEIAEEQLPPPAEIAQIAQIANLEVPLASESRTSNDFEKKMTKSLREISVTDEAVTESKQEESTLAIAKVATLDRTKKRSLASRAFKSITPSNEAEGIPLGADGLRLVMNVLVVNDAKVSTLLNEHLLKTFRPITHSGEFIAEITIENNVVSGKVRILKSINSEFDDHVIKEIKTFTDWQGSGNKTIKISFN